jgi:hypothetical protein
LEKEGETLNWGDSYHKFKKSIFPIEVENQDKMKILKNIWRSGILIVIAYIIVFPWSDSISWIIEHVDIRNRCVHNAQGEHISSFRPKELEKCYHLDKGERKIDNKLLDEFQNMTKEMCPKLYKPDK